MTTTAPATFNAVGLGESVAELASNFPAPSPQQLQDFAQQTSGTVVSSVVQSALAGAAAGTTAGLVAGAGLTAIAVAIGADLATAATVVASAGVSIAAGTGAGTALGSTLGPIGAAVGAIVGVIVALVSIGGAKGANGFSDPRNGTTLGGEAADYLADHPTDPLLSIALAHYKGLDRAIVMALGPDFEFVGIEAFLRAVFKVSGAGVVAVNTSSAVGKAWAQFFATLRKKNVPRSVADRIAALFCDFFARVRSAEHVWTTELGVPALLYINPDAPAGSENAKTWATVDAHSASAFDGLYAAGVAKPAEPGAITYDQVPTRAGRGDWAPMTSSPYYKDLYSALQKLIASAYAQPVGGPVGTYLSEIGSQIKEQLTPAQAQIAWSVAHHTPGMKGEKKVWLLEGVDTVAAVPRASSMQLTNAQFQAIEQAINTRATMPAVTSNLVHNLRSTAPASSSSSAQPSFFARLWAWLKGLWSKVFGSSSSSALPAQGTAGLAGSAALASSPSSGWQLCILSNGACANLSDAEAAAAIDAVQGVRPPPPTFHPLVPRTAQNAEAKPAFILHDGKGLGVTLSRSQGNAAIKAINTLHETHALMGQTLSDPSSASILSRVPYDGGLVLVNEAAWRAAIAGALGGVTSSSSPPIDAAMNVLACSEDADTVAEVTSNAAAGDLVSSLVTKAMLDGQLAMERMICEAVAEGVAAGDPEAIAMAGELGLVWPANAWGTSDGAPPLTNCAARGAAFDPSAHVFLQ